jgi:hypothetical protein
MHIPRSFLLAAFVLPLISASAQQSATKPLPDIHQLMNDVREHQKQLDEVRENYTYSAAITVQQIDSKGQVSKTESEEFEVFFVKGHQIARKVKKDGKPLSDEEQKKETESVTKEVEKDEKSDSKERHEISLQQILELRQILEVMDARNPRREIYRGRPTIVFDFVGRKDAKAHGIVEDISKKLQGTAWIDETDLKVAHLDVTFNDDFRIAGGIVASIKNGSNFHFDQAPVNGEIWFLTGGEGTVALRLFLVKEIHQHITERDYDYKKFRVESEQGKDAKAVVEK